MPDSCDGLKGPPLSSDWSIPLGFESRFDRGQGQTALHYIVLYYILLYIFYTVSIYYIQACMVVEFISLSVSISLSLSLVV